MTLKNNSVPLLCYFKLGAPFHSHRSIQTGVTVRKRQIQMKKRQYFTPCDLEIWQMTLINNRAPLLCYFKLFASFYSHWSIQTGVRVRKRQNRRFFVPCDLEIWRVTLKNNRAPLLCHSKLCASLCCHMWIQTGVTVRKRLSWVLTYVTLTFDFWPWPFARTSLLSLVITPENFMMYDDGNIVKRVWRTDTRTDRRTGPFIELLDRS